MLNNSILSYNTNDGMNLLYNNKTLLSITQSYKGKRK